MMIESVVLLAMEVAGAEGVAVNLGIRNAGWSAGADQKRILVSNMSAARESLALKRFSVRSTELHRAVSSTNLPTTPVAHPGFAHRRSVTADEPGDRRARSTIVAFPSSGATRHLLPDGEKNPESAVITSVPTVKANGLHRTPSGRGWIGHKAETGEGWQAQGHPTYCAHPAVRSVYLAPAGIRGMTARGSLGQISPATP